MAYCTINDIRNYVEEEELVQLTNDRDVNAVNTLDSDTTSGYDNISLTSSDEFPNSNGCVRIDDEEIFYILNSYNTLSGLTRGYNNTVETSHSSGDIVTEIHLVDEDIITRAIVDADAEIDTYLGTVFNDVPLSDIPNSIRYTSVNIAIYNLYSRRMAIPPQIEARYNNSIKFLNNVLEGKISLGDPTIDASKDEKIIINTSEDNIIFTIENTVENTTGSLDLF